MEPLGGREGARGTGSWGRELEEQVVAAGGWMGVAKEGISKEGEVIVGVKERGGGEGKRGGGFGGEMV